MSRKLALLVGAAILCFTASGVLGPASSAHEGFGPDTLKGTWVFAESYWGSGQEAAYVGTITFVANGRCEMKWSGLKAAGGGVRPGGDTCTWEVASDGSGKVVPDGADDMYFQVSQHGKRIEYIVDSQNVGQVGRGSMTRR